MDTYYLTVPMMEGYGLERKQPRVLLLLTGIEYGQVQILQTTPLTGTRLTVGVTMRVQVM